MRSDQINRAIEQIDTKLVERTLIRCPVRIARRIWIMIATRLIWLDCISEMEDASGKTEINMEVAVDNVEEERTEEERTVSNNDMEKM